MTSRALALAALVACACAQPAPPPAPADTTCPVLWNDGRYLMGTVLEISLCVTDQAAGESLANELFAKVAGYEHMFSRFDPQSDLSRVNRAAGSRPEVVDYEFLDLTFESLEYTALTSGAFDVTVGPLVVLWTEAALRKRVPTPEELAAARARVGPEQVSHAEHETHTVGLATPGAMLDFGGIAKGWALDRVQEQLRSRGVRRALLSFGQSSIAALGKPPGWDGWGVLLGDAAGGFAGTAQLADQSLSVSGSLGQAVEIGGRRFGHVLDPRNGEPLTRERVAIATAASGALAEALSKALLVLGEREGIALLEALPDAEGLLVDADGSTWRTSGFDVAIRYEAELPQRDD